MKSDYSGLAVYGGTFDPVHFGHLRSALEAGQILGVSEVRMIPSFQPPHRDKPASSPLQRSAMLALATQDIDFLQVDDREIQRQGRSYTIDTIASIRSESGSNLPLSLIIGADAYAFLHEWHAWERLLDLTHLVILQRPGGRHQEPVENVRNWVKDKMVSDPACLGRRSAGLVCSLTLTQFEISATRIRRLIEKGEAVDYLLPEKVISYIHKHRLYVRKP